MIVYRTKMVAKSSLRKYGITIHIGINFSPIVQFGT